MAEKQKYRSINEIPIDESGRLSLQLPNKLKLKDVGVQGLTLSKTIEAGNEGDAEAIFRRTFDLAPGVELDVKAKKPEGRGGEGSFTVRIKLNKGGYVKQYARGGSTRKVRS